MITIVEENGAHVLRAACDICRKPISTSSTAFAAYSQAEGIVEFHHATCASGRPNEPAFVIPLDVALVQVIQGLGIDWKNALAEAKVAMDNPNRSIQDPSKEQVPE